MTAPFAVVAGGGTAGHVYPALAIADALVARGHEPSTIEFVGASRGMEREMVPARGYPLVALDVRGVRRGLDPRSLAANVSAVVALVRATWRCVRRFRSDRPGVVVSVGGYASLPPVLAAFVRRVPVVTVSYDVRPGRATRLAARFASASAVAFAASPLPRKVVTGAPLRPSIAAIDRRRDRAAARGALDLPEDRFVLLVVGGSLGSGHLNDVARAFAAAHARRADLAIRHVTGRRDEGVPPPITADDPLLYQSVRYEEQMDLAYAAADVVLARAGATTVAELAALGVPAIIVPWPLATDDHQSANASSLGDVGGAVVVPDDEFDAARLECELARLADPATRAAMSAAASSIGVRDGADRIAALVEERAR